MNECYFILIREIFVMCEVNNHSKMSIELCDLKYFLFGHRGISIP